MNPIVRNAAEALAREAASASLSDMNHAIRRLAESCGSEVLQDVERAMDGAWRRTHGVGSVVVETAEPAWAELKRAVAEAFPGIEVEFRTHPELIAGARIRVDDELFDHTVSGQLNRLRQHLLTTL